MKFPFPSNFYTLQTVEQKCLKGNFGFERVDGLDYVSPMRDWLLLPWTALSFSCLLSCSDETGGESDEAENRSSGGSQSETGTGGSEGVIDGGSLGIDDIVPPMGDGSLIQQRCVAPWLDQEEMFDWDDQYIVLELPSPRGTGNTFFIKSEDAVEAATYTVYNIPENCRVYEEMLGVSEVTSSGPLCLSLSLNNPQAEPVETVLIHVSGQVRIDAKFFEVDSCP